MLALSSVLRCILVQEQGRDGTQKKWIPVRVSLVKLPHRDSLCLLEASRRAGIPKMPRAALCSSWLVCYHCHCSPPSNRKIGLHGGGHRPYRDEWRKARSLLRASSTLQFFCESSRVHTAARSNCAGGATQRVILSTLGEASEHQEFRSQPRQTYRKGSLRRLLLPRPSGGTLDPQVWQSGSR